MLLSVQGNVSVHFPFSAVPFSVWHNCFPLSLGFILCLQKKNFGGFGQDIILVAISAVLAVQSLLLINFLNLLSCHHLHMTIITGDFAFCSAHSIQTKGVKDFKLLRSVSLSVHEIKRLILKNILVTVNYCPPLVVYFFTCIGRTLKFF